MLCTNNAEVLRYAAVKGRGIALPPTFIPTADLGPGRSCTVLDGFKAPEMHVCALYPPTRHLPLRMRVFIDFLVGNFTRQSDWDGTLPFRNGSKRKCP
jgi:DNA-binding transcriptional LysR family regulator